MPDPATETSPATGRIRVGIGGWNFEPWRQTFYPPGLPQNRELHWASRQLSAIEINGTFYRTQSPSSFAKWHDETPDDFQFSVKAPRYATQRRDLREAGDSIGLFMASGLSRLGAKLGPLLWQLAPTKRFDGDEIEAFLRLLPRELDGRPLRHVLEVRHASFLVPAYVERARAHGVASVFTDSPKYPSFADLSADFVYLRLMGAQADCDTGYPATTLDAFTACARTWAAGGEPAEVPKVAGDAADGRPRDVFMFMINGAKERAPAAARGVLERLSA